MGWEEVIISVLKNNRNRKRRDPREISLVLKAIRLTMDGNSFYQLRKLTEAEKAYIEALEIRRTLAEKNPEVYMPYVAMTLNNLGIIYSNTKKFSEAEKVFIESLEITRTLAEKNPEVYILPIAETLTNLGILYRNAGRYPEAEKAYIESLEITRTLAEKNPEVYMPDIATILNNLGILCRNTQRFSEAEKVFIESLEIRRTLAEKNPEVYTPSIADALTNLGNLYVSTQKLTEAEKVFIEALKKYKALAEKNPEVYIPYVAMTLHNVGTLFYNTKKFSEAEKVFIEALKIRKTLAEENPEAYVHDVATTLNNLGALYADTIRFFEAEKVYKESLEIRRTLAEKNPEVYMPDIAETLINLGIIYGNKGKFFEAEKAYIEALEIRRTLAEKNPEVYMPGIADALTNLGNLYVSTQKLTEAEKVFIESLEIRRTLAEKNPEVYMPDIATILNNLGALYADTIRFFEAEKVYKESLEIRRTLAERNPEVYMPDIADVLTNLGNLYVSTQKLTEAEKVFIESLEIRRTLAEKNPEVYMPDIATILNSLGACYWNKQKFFEAEKAYIEALEIRRTLAEKNPEVYTPGIAGTLNNLGILYSDTGRYSEAEKIYTEALKIYRQAKLWFGAARSACNLAMIRSDKEILERSRKLLELAILFSKEEKYKYIQKGKSERIYLSLLDQKLDLFNVLETLRDPSLLSLPWSQVIKQAEIEKAQDDAEFQKILIDKALKMKVSSRLIPNGLLENSLFIYVQRLEDCFYFFLAKSDGTQRFKCQKEFSTIGKNLLYILKMQQCAARRGHDLTSIIEKFDDLSRKWFETLPWEIRRLIQETDQIIFSPDHYCSFFPLEAMEIDEQALCIEKTVIRATSLHQFLSLLKKKPSFGSQLIVGNPWPKCDKEQKIYSLPSGTKQVGISFLNGAQKEAEALAAAFPNATILLGQNATGERFLSEITKHSLIHFSGHGRLGRILFLSGPLQGFPPSFEPEEFSFLRKAERSEGNKKINMMEEWHPVTDLDLFDVPLTDGTVVFLNACETGKHKYAGGGHYQGLSAVFLKNGAHSVVSSLIPIFDDHSKEFAYHFYEIFLKTHSISQSLKEARIQIRNTHKAQIYWMPYIHYGSPL